MMLHLSNRADAMQPTGAGAAPSQLLLLLGGVGERRLRLALILARVLRLCITGL
jgi:hypothetical protein